MLRYDDVFDAEIDSKPNVIIIIINFKNHLRVLFVLKGFINGCHNRPSQFCIWSHWQDGGLHGRHLYTDSHVGNKGFWAFTVNCSGIEIHQKLCTGMAILLLITIAIFIIIKALICRPLCSKVQQKIIIYWNLVKYHKYHHSTRFKQSQMYKNTNSSRF